MGRARRAFHAVQHTGLPSNVSTHTSHLDI
jgi:hypothetical protein